VGHCDEDLTGLMRSWKKVTTNVSNFIMGTPIIDHYGDLVVSELSGTFTSEYTGDRRADDSQPSHRRDMHAHIQTPRLARRERIRDQGQRG